MLLLWTAETNQAEVVQSPQLVTNELLGVENLVRALVCIVFASALRHYMPGSKGTVCRSFREQRQVQSGASSMSWFRLQQHTRLGGGLKESAACRRLDQRASFPPSFFPLSFNGLFLIISRDNLQKEVFRGGRTYAENAKKNRRDWLLLPLVAS